MPRFSTLELTEEETLIRKLNLEGKSSSKIAAALGINKNRVGWVLDRANRKVAAKERLKLEGNRKIRF